MLDRLVRGAVLAEPDRVVRHDVDHALLHQRRHAHCVARVVGEHQERAAVRDYATVQCHAVHHRAHAELAHAVVQVIAGRVAAAEYLRILAIGVVRAGEIGRAAEQLGHPRTERIERLLRSLARRDARIRLHCLRQVVAHNVAPRGGQVALHPPLVLSCKLRERCPVRREPFAPLCFARGALLTRVPVAANVVRDHERLRRPIQLAACGRNLVCTQRRAVRGLGALLVRRAVADDGLATDQRRPLRLSRGRGDRGLDRSRIVAVDVADDVPAVGLETLRRVIGEPAVHFAVDRDAVVIVEGDQLAELQRAGQRARLV